MCVAATNEVTDCVRVDEPREYKTPLSRRQALKAKRDAIKAAGGPEYEALVAKERAARARFRTENYDRYVERRRSAEKKKKQPFKTWLCAQARFRGRKKGLPATIKPGDLVWPSHCPVLGIELDYPKRSGERGTQPVQANWPSLDRWDSAKGYVPGNVFVISYRANTLKNNAKRDEILHVARYVMNKPKYGPAVILPLFEAVA